MGPLQGLQLLKVVVLQFAFEMLDLLGVVSFSVVELCLELFLVFLQLQNFVVSLCGDSFQFSNIVVELLLSFFQLLSAPANFMLRG